MAFIFFFCEVGLGILGGCNILVCNNWTMSLEGRAVVDDPFQMSHLNKQVPVTTYHYPLSQTTTCWATEECCQKKIQALYSYSRIHPWVKGPGYMDRYRDPNAATRLHHGDFWDFYVCPTCGGECGNGPNSHDNLTEESKNARTWKEPSDEIL